jgi:hypothetical protein
MIWDGRILLLFTDEMSLIRFEAQAEVASLFFSGSPAIPAAFGQQTEAFGNDVAAARIDRVAYHAKVIRLGPRREPQYGRCRTPRNLLLAPGLSWDSLRSQFRASAGAGARYHGARGQFLLWRYR